MNTERIYALFTPWLPLGNAADHDRPALLGREFPVFNDRDRAPLMSMPVRVGA